MDVHGRSKFSQRERRTFNVPPRTPWPPARLPRGLVSEGRLPQHKVKRVSLKGIVNIATVLGGQDQHFLIVIVTDVAKGREGADVKVDRPSRFVGRTLFDRRANERQDLWDGRGGSRFREHREEAERIHLRVEHSNLFGRQIEVMHAEFTGFLQDVVVNIGHVSHTTSLVAQIPKATLQDVEGQIDLGMA